MMIHHLVDPNIATESVTGMMTRLHLAGAIRLLGIGLGKIHQGVAETDMTTMTTIHRLASGERNLANATAIGTTIEATGPMEETQNGDLETTTTVATEQTAAMVVEIERGTANEEDPGTESMTSATAARAAIHRLVKSLARRIDTGLETRTVTSTGLPETRSRRRATKFSTQTR